MRKIRIAPEEYYHIYNRGVNKGVIFSDQKDYYRFLFLVLYFQSSLPVKNIARVTKEFREKLNCSIDPREIAKDRKVELVSFCLMPNHFHLIVKEVEDSGIAAYMQRVLNAYTKYFNTKYEKSGHLFQGPYQAVHVGDNRQLTYLSAYIHRNPRGIRVWTGKEDQYRWSSYQDFLKENRWKELLVTDIISDQFKNSKEYKNFVETSTAKMLEEELGEIVQHSVLHT